MKKSVRALFENICYYNGKFAYFSIHDSTKLAKLYLSGRPEGPLFSIDVLPETRPSDLSTNDGLSMFINVMIPENFGHVLGDSAWPLFQGMSMFKLTNYDGQVYTHNRLGRAEDQLRSVSSKTAKTFSSLKQNVCFEKVLVGWGRLGYGYGSGLLKNRIPAWGRGILLSSWRDFVSNSLSISQIDSINGLVIVKDSKKAVHKFSIQNGEELVKSVQLPGSMRKVIWTGVSFKQQFFILSKVRIVVATPGSDLMPLIFLPDHSLVIIFCRVCPEEPETGWQRVSNEARLWLYHRPYLQVDDICDHKPEQLLEDSQYLIVDPSTVQKSVDRWLLSQRLTFNNIQRLNK